MLWIMQMSGLNIYSFVDESDIQFYKTQRSLAKKMDILDWIPGSYVEEIVQGGENPLDMARRINPEEFAFRAPVQMPEPLIELHPGNPALTGTVELGEDEEEETRLKETWRKGPQDSLKSPKPRSERRPCVLRRRRAS
jgi:hypothetical protein